jgi:TetR/AcrR family transcriptional regulator, transcriptional repressor for nem operon
MARPKEFDVDAAFAIAQTLFWEKGFDATSTEDLRLAMGIGRQSFYDTFGGKRDVFLATLRRYVDERFDDTMRVLSGAPSPLGGVERLLQSVAEESPEKRARGCFGVSTMCALGASDEDVRRVGEAATKRLVDALAAALVRAKESGEVDPGLHEREEAAHLHATLVGSRVLAKGGARPEMLRSIATSAVAKLRPRAPKRR